MNRNNVAPQLYDSWIRGPLFVLLMLSIVFWRGSGSAQEMAWPAAFPEADRIGAVEGVPPVAPAFRGNRLIGWLLSTKDIMGGGGYNARPLDVLLGLGIDCRITGVVLREQHEPILLLGLGGDALAAFVRQYVGLDIMRAVRLDTVTEGQSVQAISRATISSYALHDVILGAARAVARARDLPCAARGAGKVRIEIDAFQPEGWDELRADGSIAQLRLTAGQVSEALRQAGVPDPAAALLPLQADYAMLYAALATPAQIGANLLGRQAHARLLAELPPEWSVVFVAGAGAWSFKGTAWVRTGVFERLQIVQGERTIVLTAAQHQPIERLRATAAPELRETALFLLSPESGFDPALPWRLDFAVTGRRPDGSQASAVFGLPYALPRQHLVPAPAMEEPALGASPLWHRAWAAQSERLVVLSLALLTLCAVLLFQGPLVRRPDLWRLVRLMSLSFTLLWLGWWAGAQLSVVQLLSFVAALRQGFRWEPFLLDPLGFVLWGFVAATLLLWGRGVFCGWLCPFGALQELLNTMARRVGVPQWTLPFGLHERLWPVKYLVFLGLLGLSFGSAETAIAAAEVEPFKTAIVLRFLRSWPFLSYALALLAAGLFVERFFCRYLCPLGAALALPARLRVFDWLRRYRSCGAPCQLCATRCPVQAIHPDGRINPNECIHCLKCQTLYHDERRCLVLTQRRRLQVGTALMPKAARR